MSLERIKLVDNKLMGRKEATYKFSASAGMITKSQGVKMVAANLGVKEDNVIPVSIRGRQGSRDVTGTFYVFEDMKVAKAQLPHYVFLRGMAKADRKKYFEDKRKSKTKKVQAPKK